MATGKDPTEKDCAFYIDTSFNQRGTESSINPTSFLSALDAVCGTGKFEINIIEDEHVELTGEIAPDIRGLEGLTELKRHFDEGIEKGKTSGSLKLLKFVATEPKMNPEGDSLTLKMKFRLVPLNITPPDDKEF